MTITKNTYSKTGRNGTYIIALFTGLTEGAQLIADERIPMDHLLSYDQTGKTVIWYSP